MGKAAFRESKALQTGKMDLDLRKRIMKSTIRSMALYGAETWTMTKNHRNKLEAFEMWLWRRMLKFNWTEKVSNQQVLARIQEERSLLNSIQQRKT